MDKLGKIFELREKYRNLYSFYKSEYDLKTDSDNEANDWLEFDFIIYSYD